ncbi:MAG: tetratricopeptide repeat protein [Myxococcales bacterium]|jgi:hypothetical protein|nr:tetratricopeptide repeat protein [Myxococcales bacterium]
MTQSPDAARRRLRLSLITALLVVLASSTGVNMAFAATTLSPLCQLQDGKLLFFAEATRSCPGAIASCRETFWSYATLTSQGPNHWSFQPAGSARLDENATAQSNGLNAKQLFAAPSDVPCANFFRAPRLLSPDLPDAEGWFRYSFEKGQMMIHWKTLKRAIPFQTRWTVALCQSNCGQGGPGPRVSPVDQKNLTDIPESDPTFDLHLDGVAIVGFPPPGVKSERSTGWIASLPLDSLKKAQADLLYRDALNFSQSARDDLLGGSMLVGLLDAALQLDPDNQAIRLDYARHLASQSLAALAVRELKLLPVTPDFKARLGKDAAFSPIRGDAIFQKFIASLP